MVTLKNAKFTVFEIQKRFSKLMSKWLRLFSAKIIKGNIGSISGSERFVSWFEHAFEQLFQTKR